jgi:hypothetical protein
MSDFVPTWLYCKVHNKTGLKYLGKTIQNPYKYPGSGVYWTNHINKHGNDVSTVWAHLYHDKETLVKESLFFSKVYNIVEDSSWANLTEENGTSGGKTYQRSANHNKKMSRSLTGIIFSEEHRKNISEANKGRKKGPMSDDSKLKKSIALTGRKKSTATKEKMRLAALRQHEIARTKGVK